MKPIHIIALSLTVLLLGSCDIKKNNVSPDASFARLYESTYVSDAYYPLSLIQTDDKGYLILSAIWDSSSDSHFPKPHLIYTDQQGSVLSDSIVNGYEAPVPSLMKIGSAYYFVCTNSTAFQVIMEVNVSGKTITYKQKTQISGNEGNNDPLFAWNDGSDIIILGYDLVGWTSQITKYANFGSDQVYSSPPFEAKEQGFSPVVDNHLKRTGKQIPFFGGNIKPSGGYFVNCLYNSSLSLIFLDKNCEPTGGNIYSHQLDGVLSSALYLRNDTFAVSRYYTGDNFVYPLVGLDLTKIQNANNFQDIFVSQLKEDAQTKVIKYQFNNKDLIVYASTTKSDQIILLFFDALTGKQLYTDYLGKGNPVEVKDLIATSDGGLAVLGKTWINGQYPRVILYKVDKKQLDIKFD